MAPDDKGGLSHMLLKYHGMSINELIEIRDESVYKSVKRLCLDARECFLEWENNMRQYKWQ